MCADVQRKKIITINSFIDSIQKFKTIEKEVALTNSKKTIFQNVDGLCLLNRSLR